MPELVTKCLLCEKEEFHLFDQRVFRGKEIVNQICKHCGLVFQSPRMTEEELSNFYLSEYRDLYQGSEGPTQKDLYIQSGRAKYLVDFLDSQGVLPFRYLDIGCSAGVLMKRFKESYACEVAGIEPGSVYQDYAKQQGLTTYSSLNDLAHSDKEQFDMVSMSHVLEHIPNPVEYLSSLREHYLTPDGWLLIEVPNLYAHDSFEIAHLISFSPHTLRETLKKAGFEITAARKHGQPRSDLLPLYLTLLAKPREDSFSEYQVQPEQTVVLKRKIGMLRRRVLGYLRPHQAWIPFPKE